MILHRYTLLLAAVLLAATLTFAASYFLHISARELDPPSAAAAALPSAVSAATFYTDTYNANFPFSIHIYDVDSDGSQELVLGGVLSDYSLIATPNTRCSWCNQWRLSSYAWHGSTLTPERTGTLDNGYDITMVSAIGSMRGATKVVGVGNMAPCGSGEPHAGMAVFNATLQKEHLDWGARRSDPCHHDMSAFTAVDIADLDGDGTVEIVAGGSGDPTGGGDTYRAWLLTIRASDGAAFTEELYTHFDHGSGTETLTDLAVADVDSDGDLEIVATGYSYSTGVPRTVLRIMTWLGTPRTLTTEYADRFNIGAEDRLERLALGDLNGDGKPEIVLAGAVKTGSTRDWHVKVVHWENNTLTPVADKTWSFGQDAMAQAVALADMDEDGPAEVVLAGHTRQDAVPGSSGGYYFVHYYADWHLKVLSLAGASFTDMVTEQWNSSRNYDTNNNGRPDPGDAGAQGRLYDLAVGDLDRDGHPDIALAGEWVWVGWHTRLLLSAGGGALPPKLKLLFVPLGWPGTQASFDTEAQTQSDVFLDDVPLKHCKEQFITDTLDVATQNFTAFTCSRSNCGVSSVRAYVRDTLHINPADYDVIVGLAESSPCSPIDGCSNGTDTIWVTAKYDCVTAHELGHIYGLEDEYCSNQAGSRDSRCNDGDSQGDGATTGDVNWLDASLPYDCPPDGANDSGGSPCCNLPGFSCAVVDYNPCCYGNKNSAGGRSTMSYTNAPGPRGFDSHDLAHLNSLPQLACASASSATGSGQEWLTAGASQAVLDINLRVHPDDSVDEVSISLARGRPTPQSVLQGMAGDYSLKIASAGGVALWTQTFALYFDYTGPVVLGEDYSGIHYDQVAVEFRIPYRCGMSGLNLYHGGSLIFVRSLPSMKCLFLPLILRAN